MQFMPSVQIVCEECRGQKFRDEVLAVKFRGLSILEVLALPVKQAFSSFADSQKSRPD